MEAKDKTCNLRFPTNCTIFLPDVSSPLLFYDFSFESSFAIYRIGRGNIVHIQLLINIYQNLLINIKYTLLFHKRLNRKEFTEVTKISLNTIFDQNEIKIEKMAKIGGNF